MVIAAKRVARHESFAGVVDHPPAVGGTRRTIVDARGDHAQRAGHEFSRPRASGSVLCHIIHLAMKTRAQPLAQARFGVAQIDVRYPDFLKSKLPTPFPNLPREQRQVERRSGIFDFYHGFQS